MDVPSYQAGYADAKAGKASQYPPTPPPPPPPSIRVIQPAENIETVIDAGTTTTGPVALFQLVAGQTYRVAGGWSPKNGNFDLDGQGANVVIAEPSAASSGISTSKPNCTFRNLAFSYTTTGNFVLFRFKAPLCSAINCSLSGPIIATFGFADVGGTHALFQACTVPLTNSVSIYACEDDCLVIGNTITGGVGETSVRVDSPSGTTRLPLRVMIKNNTIHSSGKNAKGGLELRMVGAGSQVSGNTFVSAYVTVGQGTGMKTVDQSIAGLTITQNIFSTVDPSIGTCLLIRNGIVTATGNSYPPVGPTMHYPLQISGPLDLTVDGPGLFNTTQPLPANVHVTGG